MFGGKSSVYYTSLFSPYSFEKMLIWSSLIILKMNKGNSKETLNKYLDLSSQTKFRLNEIKEIKDYFNSENQERKPMNKKLSKYIAVFDYIDKTLIVLSARSGGICIISFASIIAVPEGIESLRFTLVFF